MSLDSPQGPMSIAVLLKVDGTKVTGTLTSQMGETALQGQYVEGVLNFGITFEGGGGSMQISFAGKLKDEKHPGRLALRPDGRPPVVGRARQGIGGLPVSFPGPS